MSGNRRITREEELAIRERVRIEMSERRKEGFFSLRASLRRMTKATVACGIFVVVYLLTQG